MKSPLHMARSHISCAGLTLCRMRKSPSTCWCTACSALDSASDVLFVVPSRQSSEQLRPSYKDLPEARMALRMPCQRVVAGMSVVFIGRHCASTSETRQDISCNSEPQCV